MYCQSCGKPQPSGAAYCPYCGSKQSEMTADSVPPVSVSELSPVLGASPGALTSPIDTDFPTGDMEPIALYEGREWTFRYKDAANPPPAWTQRKIDLMFSDDYIVFQSDTNVATLKETLKQVGALAGVIAAGTIAGAVPVLGIAAGAAALTLGKTISKQTKPVGYGKDNQFTREVMLQKFLAGEAIWARKCECEFRVPKSRLLLNTTCHYFVTIGQFHHVSGLLDYAAFNCLSGIHGNFIERSGCALAREEKFKVRSEAMRSLVGYPEPPITKDRDDKWL